MNIFRTLVLVGSFSSCTLFAQAPAASAPAAISPAPAPAAPEFKPLAGPIELKDGDTFVFLGDSITHQCLYTQYVEDYFYTRFPKVRVRFHNAGVGGDRAADALRRFDQDVAAFQPKYVSILLGMNDGTYTRYEQAVFDTYQKGMTELLDKLEGLGARVIPMTPTMHDARAARLRGKTQEPRDTYYNGVLALYGTWLREVAHQRGLGFVDMWGPLNNLTQEQRRKDANFTLITDAVHPDAPGQFVMAAAFINDMAPKSPVSNILVHAPNGKFTSRVVNGALSELAASPERVNFTFTANALPWVVPDEAALGYQLTKAGHRNSNEKLIVRNLAAGKYELKIDGEPVGTYTDGQLAFGVELQGNAKTPQYQQALRVAMLNKQRNDEAMRPLRNLWRDRKVKQREVDAATARKAADLEQKKEALAVFAGEFQGKAEALIAKAREFEARIYEENQPKPRRYELVAVK
jgi:lysophospholipase L1-like esterase